MNKERKRMCNGYVAIYKPTHFNVMKSKNWKGWAYEHRYLIEVELGRPLEPDEIVHHLDCDRTNNHIDNLLLLPNRAYHMKLHNWIDAGKKIHNDYVPKNVRHYGKHLPLCKYCNDNPVQLHNNEYCSPECCSLANRKVEDRPSIDVLIQLLKHNNYCYVGRLYGVSDNAVRKWVNRNGYDPKTLKPLTRNKSEDIMES